MENNIVIKRIISSKIKRTVITKYMPIHPNFFPIFANPFPLYFFGFSLIFFSPNLPKIIAEIKPASPNNPII